MSHLRLTTSVEVADDAPPSPGAVKFASFTPMNDQPALADRKATFVIGASGLLLTTTMYFAMPLRQFVRPGVFPAVTLALSLALAVAALVAIRTAYRCYMLAAPVPPDNLLFFQNIAAGPSARYAQALESATARDALRDVLAYNHTMARLGAAKYRLAGRALLCLRVAIPLWVMLLIVITAQAV
jgi:hypothetical protein